MSNFDYDSATATTPTIGDEEPIYLSSSDEDENVPKYTQASVAMTEEQDDDAEPISDDEINDNNNEEDDDEDSYIPTAKSSLSHNPNGSDEDESDHSDTDYDGPYGGGGSDGRRRPIKVYDEYDPENLDVDDDEASPNAKYRAMRRGLTNAGKPTMRTAMFSSYQVNKYTFL